MKVTWNKSFDWLFDFRSRFSCVKQILVPGKRAVKLQSQKSLEYSVGNSLKCCIFYWHSPTLECSLQSRECPFLFFSVSPFSSLPPLFWSTPIHLFQFSLSMRHTHTLFFQFFKYKLILLCQLACAHSHKYIWFIWRSGKRMVK